MSSFLYPDQHTRFLFNDGRCHPKTGNPYTEHEKHIHWVRKKQRHESMIARAQRLTSERMQQEQKVAEQVTIYQTIKSKVSNFLKRLFA